MATTLQFRRGTTAELAAITGAEAELFVDTDKTTVVVMDGVTSGGIPLATEAYVDTAVSNVSVDLTGYATETYVGTAIANLVDTAPTTLDTLNELAAALGDDANFATTVTNSLAAKADSSSLATVATSGLYSDLTGAPTIPADIGDLTDTGGLLSAGGGSGLFNDGINGSVGYAITTSMANAVTFTADAIVHSIFLSNVNTAAAITVDSNFTPSGGTATGMFLSIPMPIGSSVEMLKKPMVVKNGDAIAFKCSTASSAYVTIVYETATTANYNRSIALAQLTAASTLYTSTTYPSVIESIRIANVDAAAGDHAITISWTNSSDTVKSYLSYELIVPTGATVELTKNPKFMAAGDKIVIQSTYNDTLSVYLSAKSITG